MNAKNEEPKLSFNKIFDSDPYLVAVATVKLYNQEYHASTRNKLYQASCIMGPEAALDRAVEKWKASR